MLVRKANHDDISKIIEIMQINLLRNHSTVDAASNAGFLRGEYSTDYFAEVIESFPKKIALVATENNNIVGYSMGQSLDLVEESLANNLKNFCNFNNDNFDRNILYQNIFYHRQIAKLPNAKGAGFALIKELLIQLRQEKYQATICIIAEKPLTNHASIKFHQSQNFARVGEFYDKNRDLDFGVFYRDL